VERSKTAARSPQGNQSVFGNLKRETKRNEDPPLGNDKLKYGEISRFGRSKNVEQGIFKCREFILDWKTDGKRGTTCGAILSLHLAAMGFCKSFHQRESESRASRPGIGCPVKLLE
jgi:hypothetical protein